MANSCINKGIAQAGQVSMNYGCSVPTVPNQAVTKFSNNVNSAKNTANARISSIKAQKKVQWVYTNLIGRSEEDYYGFLLGEQELEGRMIMKKILSIIIGLATIVLPIWLQNIRKDKEVIKHFYAIYNDKNSLDEFCDNHNTYDMEIELKETRIWFGIEKDDSNKWRGKLALYNNSEWIEEIPVLIEGEEIVIKTSPEKRISTDILLFKQFKTEKCTIKEVTSQVLFEPSLEEVLGNYPEDELKIYMQTLYNELISNLTLFDKKDEYFLAVDELHGFGFNRYAGNTEHICYSLSFAFKGNQEEKWNPGFCNFEDVSLIFSETTPVSW